MKEKYNRGTGLLVIEVRNSNPNGDPDQESDPRTLDVDGRGIISPVSIKRKLRDIVLDGSAAMDAAAEALKLDRSRFGILEQRGRKRDEIQKMERDEFQQAFWDARIFGNTFLESMKNADAESKNRDLNHFISTGSVQVGVGVSVAPIEIDRMTNTNKSGVEEGKDRGMAPLAFRVVRHGVYAVPFFFNPAIAQKTGATQKDLDLLKFLLPHIYTQTASAIRPFVNVLHAWYGEHHSPLGSCPDPLLIDVLTPQLVDVNTPPKDLGHYKVPGIGSIPEEISNRFKSIEDLCAKKWE